MGVSHNSAVAWDKAKFKRGEEKTRVPQGSQMSRKSLLFRDTLVSPVSAVTMDYGISCFKIFGIFLQLVLQKKLLKYQGCRVRFAG